MVIGYMKDKHVIGTIFSSVKQHRRPNGEPRTLKLIFKIKF